MAADPGKKEIIDAIEDLAKVIEETLEKVKAFENESVDDFVENKQGNLLPPLVKYAECFKALGVKTRQQLDTLVKQHFKDHDVQDVWNYLEESEVEWNKFLQGVDSKLEKWSKTKQAPAVGDLGPVDIPLVNARTNKQVSIKDYIGEKSVLLVLLRHFA